jgi:heat shock protein HtpX
MSVSSFQSQSQEIKTELTQDQTKNFLNYLEKHYLLARVPYVTSIRKGIIDGKPIVSFREHDAEWKLWVEATIVGDDPLTVIFQPCDPRLFQTVCRVIVNDVRFHLEGYKEELRRTTLYFTFLRHPKIVPVRRQPIVARMLGRIFTGSMINFYMIFLFIGFFILYIFLGPYTPIALVAIQFLLVASSDQIMMRLGDWILTPENPDVILLSYQTSREEYAQIVAKHSARFKEMKEKIYRATLAQGKEIDCKTARYVFEQYGIKCLPENMSVRDVNVYKTATEVARDFGLKIPKISIVNTWVPNAAATGIMPSRSTVLMTSGLLLRLREEEIRGVLGHELSHVRSHDPLILFALTSGEYLLRVYFLWQYLFFLGFFYLFIMFTVIFFIGKFLETRADTESALITKDPMSLASGLRKIGFRRLYYEQAPSVRLQEWLGWDPHPPMYFRIARLEKLPERIKHPWIQSITDVFKGFRQALH